MTNTLIAILGAGQLGRMLALAGIPLGLRFRLLDSAPHSPASSLAPQILASFSDRDALAELAAGAACVTYEFENVPVAAANVVEQYAPVFPPAAALETAQDRLVEKQFFTALGAQTPPFAPVDSRDELAAALAKIGLPAVLKTRRLGYDGKGQAVIRTPEEADAAWATLGGQLLILEGFVAFRRELSIIAVRGRDGAVAFYPLIENTHHEGILRRSLAPAPGVSAALQIEAERIARAALERLGYVGVLAIELFEVSEDRTKNKEQRTDIRDPSPQLPAPSLEAATVHPTLLVNEMAPRVHNSGHWTIEGAETSQFENHLRAIVGLPLGSTAPRGHSAMLNLIGRLPDTRALLEIEGAHLHVYGKTARPGRKLGHLTLRSEEPRVLAERTVLAEGIIATPPQSP